MGRQDKDTLHFFFLSIYHLTNRCDLRYTNVTQSKKYAMPVNNDAYVKK